MKKLTGRTVALLAGVCALALLLIFCAEIVAYLEPFGTEPQTMALPETVDSVSATGIRTDKDGGVIQYGTKDGRLGFVVFTILPNSHPARSDDGGVEGGVITTHHANGTVDAVLKVAPGELIDLPVQNSQLFEYRNGRYVSVEGSVTLPELEEYLESSETGFGVESLLSFVEESRRKNR